MPPTPHKKLSILADAYRLGRKQWSLFP